MSKAPKFLILTLTWMAINAHAGVKEVPIVDAPQPEQVIQSVVFKGAPGRTAMASIIDPQDGTDLILWITHQKPNDVRYYSVVDTNKLGLTHGGMAGTESTLSVSRTGALEIHQQNQSIGRNRWERTLTVGFKNGRYLVIGYTFSSDDTIDPKAKQSCDYNLLTGNGLKNGKKVTVRRLALPIERLSDSEKLYSCQGW